MAGMRTNRLFDVEYDEVSSVDRPANQHGLIVLSKSMDGSEGEEQGMGEVTEVFDAAGELLDLDGLEHGQEVFDADGNEFVFVESDLESVDKAKFGAVVSRIGSSLERAADRTRFGQGVKAGMSGTGGSGVQGASGRAGRWIGRNPKKTAAIGATGGVGVAGGGAYLMGEKDEAKKSLGDTVLERLSKAATDSDRDEITKAMATELEQLRADNEAITKAFEEAEDERVTEAFISKAAEYNLPVPAEVFGPILKSIAEVLDEDELDILDAVLTAGGDALYEELGYAGGASNSGVLDQVQGMAQEMVAKAAGNFSVEQATTAMFETNPEAYDAYLAENGR
jgi:hypothetical protein